MKNKKKNKNLSKTIAVLTVLVFGLGFSLAPALAAEGNQQAQDMSGKDKTGQQTQQPDQHRQPIDQHDQQQSSDQHQEIGTTTPPASHLGDSSEREDQGKLGESSGDMSDRGNGGGGSGGGEHGTTTQASLAAQDFGVVNYDTGLGILKGYTAGFGLTNATFAGAQSVVVQLYSSTTLLQTNTALPKLGATITGAQISSPFDVLGSFNYATDGYWANVRGSEYGLHLIPTRVVATVKLASGQIVTAENNVLTGDTSIIVPTPAPATGPTLSFLNSANVGSNSANVFWLSSDLANARIWLSTTTPVDTTGTPAASDMTNSLFHFLSLTGLTPSTTYHYVVASTDAMGTTYSPDAIFTTGP